jgi:glyoxalase superfamily protein
MDDRPICPLNKTVKPRTSRNRLHLDLYTDNQEVEVERLVAAGATRYPWRYRPGADFVVLEDPDGNLFCVVQIAGFEVRR